MGGYQVGAFFVERIPKRAGRLQITQRVNRPPQRGQRPATNAVTLQAFDQRPPPPAHHDHVMPRIPHGAGHFRHMHLGAGERIGARDRIQDLHGAPVHTARSRPRSSASFAVSSA